MNKKIITSSILIILLIILIAFGVSYAYFQANVFGNETSNTISAGGATLKIEYASDSTITANNIVPGWSDTKYFQVNITNTKQETINYNINLVISNSNFYTTDTNGNSYLTYHLYECTSSSDTTCSTELSTQTVIDINGSGTKTLKQITNTKSETKYYALKIEFPNQNVEQSQEGIDNNPLTFNGYVTINSSNKYFEGPTAAEYLASLDKESNSLEVDDTDDQNLRYVGATPKNYISFNNEIWRIIGIFNVYNNDTKQNEKLIKIIRNESLGDYSWDTSTSSINEGYGINEWSQAKLMYELNCDGSESKYCNSDIEITEGYLSNKTSGTTTWYNGNNNAKSGSYDYSQNIKSGYIDKIANVRWNLGGSSSPSISSKSFYTLERGTLHVSDPSDGVTRTNTWDGKIGLMYPSDYGYASTDTTCRGNLLLSNCKNNNWLFNSVSQRTLSPCSVYAYSVFYVDSTGGVYGNPPSLTFGVRPALFLKSDVLITGGTGESIEKAYTLE